MSDADPTDAEVVPGPVLLVRMADGSEQAYPLAPGVYRLGSNEYWCEIVVRHPAFGPVHALLRVSEAQVVYEEVVHQEDSQAEPTYGAQTLLDEGDALTIGDVEICLFGRYKAPDAERLAAPGGTLGLKQHGVAELAWGALAYPIFQRLLAAEISPDEARAAEERFERGLRAFLWTVTGFGVWMGIKFCVIPLDAVAWAAWHDDLAWAGCLVAAAALGSLAEFPYAGRLLLPLAAITGYSAPPLYDWVQMVGYGSTALLGSLGVNFLVGWTIDFGAARQPSRRWPAARSIVLSAAALWLAMTFAWEWRSDPSGTVVRFCSLAAAALLLVFAWLPDEWLAPYRPAAASIDEQTVTDAAANRWCFLSTGQMLAVLLGSLSLVYFLCSLSSETRLQLPAGATDIVRSPPVRGTAGADPAQEYGWYWETRGRYLTAADFQRDEEPIYGYPAAPPLTPRATTDGGPDTKTREAIDEELDAPRFTQSRAEAEESFRRLKQLLTPYRLRSPAEFIELEKSRDSRVLLLREVRTRPLPGYPAGASVYHWGELKVRQHIPSEHAWLLSAGHYAYLVFAIFGLVVLWRRGGESPLAQWLAIFLLSTSTALYYYDGWPYFDALQFSLWQYAVERSQLAALGLVWLVTATLLNMVAMILAMLMIPWAGLWVHLCWPPGRQTAESGWLEWFFTAFKIGVVALAHILVMTLFAGILQGLLFGDYTDNTATLCGFAMGATAAVLLGAGLGLLVRTHTAHRSEIPVLTWRSVLGALLAVAAALLLLIAENGKFSSATANLAAFWLGIAALAGATASWFAGIVLDNVLRLAAVRDLSVVSVTAIFPFAFEATENLLGYFLRDAQLLLGGEQSLDVLAVIVVVLAPAPLLSWLEARFVELSVPFSKRLEGAIEEAAARLAAGDPDPPELLAWLLGQFDVKDFGYYLRLEDGSCRRVLGTLPGAAEELPLSPELAAFLAGEGRFHDLEQVPYEWHYFFQQFELYRLQQSVRGRFLLPILVGPHLTGLLVLGPSDAAENFARDAVAERLMPLAGAVAVAR